MIKALHYYCLYVFIWLDLIIFIFNTIINMLEGRDKLYPIPLGSLPPFDCLNQCGDTCYVFCYYLAVSKAVGFFGCKKAIFVIICNCQTKPNILTLMKHYIFIYNLDKNTCSVSVCFFDVILVLFGDSWSHVFFMRSFGYAFFITWR